MMKVDKKKNSASKRQEERSGGGPQTGASQPGICGPPEKKLERQKEKKMN